MSTIRIIALTLAAAPAFAGKAPTAPEGRQEQVQLQGQVQGQLATGGDALAGAVSDSEASALSGSLSSSGDSVSSSRAAGDSTAANQTHISSEYREARQVPVMIQGIVIPVDCGFGGNAGAANTSGAGFLGASWTTDRCYTLKTGNAFAAIGEYALACELWSDVARRALKRRGITNIDCGVIAANLRAQHVQAVQRTAPVTPVYVTPEQLTETVDRAFRHSVAK